MALLTIDGFHCNVSETQCYPSYLLLKKLYRPTWTDPSVDGPLGPRVPDSEILLALNISCEHNLAQKRVYSKHKN